MRTDYNVTPETKLNQKTIRCLNDFEKKTNIFDAVNYHFRIYCNTLQKVYLSKNSKTYSSSKYIYSFKVNSLYYTFLQPQVQESLIVSKPTCITGGKSSKVTLFLLATGTGQDMRDKIQDSISRKSCKTTPEAFPPFAPLKRAQMLENKSVYVERKCKMTHLQ